MFELGFGKLLLIGIVALIVLGPERLPKAARFAGLWMRRVRAYWFNMRAELERELAAEEMRKQLDGAKQIVHETGNSVRETLTPPSAGTAAEAAAPAGADPQHDNSDHTR